MGFFCPFHLSHSLDICLLFFETILTMTWVWGSTPASILLDRRLGDSLKSLNSKPHTTLLNQSWRWQGQGSFTVPPNKHSYSPRTPSRL